MERRRTSGPSGAPRIRDPEIRLDAAGADGTLEPGRHVDGVWFGGRHTEARPLERPVDRQPLAVLACLALAGRKRRQPPGSRGDVVALAVGEHLIENLLFSERRSAHAPRMPKGPSFVNLFQ
jgi:hypothetical protein